MGTTTRGLPYPEGTAPVRNGSSDIKALAQLLDPPVLSPVMASGWSAPDSGKGKFGFQIVAGRLFMFGSIWRNANNIPGSFENCFSHALLGGFGMNPTSWFGLVVPYGDNSNAVTGDPQGFCYMRIFGNGSAQIRRDVTGGLNGNLGGFVYLNGITYRAAANTSAS